MIHYHNYRSGCGCLFWLIVLMIVLAAISNGG